MLKIDTYYDVQCDECYRNRSTDFELGFETKIKRLRSESKKEGWVYDKTTNKNVCPTCIRKRKEINNA